MGWDVVKQEGIDNNDLACSYIISPPVTVLLSLTSDPIYPPASSLHRVSTAIPGFIYYQECQCNYPCPARSKIFYSPLSGNSLILMWSIVLTTI